MKDMYCECQVHICYNSDRQSAQYKKNDIYKLLTNDIG